MIVMTSGKLGGQSNKIKWKYSKDGWKFYSPGITGIEDFKTAWR